jgi:hypothetical protein
MEAIGNEVDLGPKELSDQGATLIEAFDLLAGKLCKGVARHIVSSGCGQSIWWEKRYLVTPFRGLGTHKCRKFLYIWLKKPNRCGGGAGERF